jgi:hypothetical protein
LADYNCVEEEEEGGGAHNAIPLAGKLISLFIVGSPAINTISVYVWLWLGLGYG